MGTVVLHAENAAEPMMDALDTAIGADGCLVVYDGVFGADDDAIPSGNELVICDLSNPAFGAAADIGGAAAGSRVSGITLASTTSVAPEAGGPRTAQSFAIFSSSTVRNAANMVLKGDAGTSGTAMILDTATINTGDFNPDEANFQFKMALNQTV